MAENTPRDENKPHSEDRFTVYKWRWYVLAVASLLNVSNASIWISFSPIQNYAAAFYDRSTDDINYFSLVFFISTIPLGLVSMIVIDKAGLKTGVIIGAVLNAAGGIIRALSTAEFIPFHVMFPLSMFGQTLAGCAQAFVLIIPTKVAELWFPDNQRAIATSVVSMSNPMGIIIGALVPSLIVSSVNDIRLLNLILAIPCTIALILTVVGIRSSVPPTPPSYSATVNVQHAYLSNLKQLGTNVPYLILALTLGSGVGGISALMTVLQSFLCARGYKDTFTGICSALLTACGLIGAGICGAIVDKTKLFTEVTKICFSFTAFATIFFSVIVQRYNQQVAIAISCALIGFFGFAAYPIGLELGVECSYPVPEATSSGIIIILGQLIGIILVQVLSVIREPLHGTEKQLAACAVQDVSGNSNTTIFKDIEAYDMTVPGLSFAGFLSLVSIVLIIFFKTEYKRMRAENSDKSKKSSDLSSLTASTNSVNSTSNYSAIYS